MNEKKAWNVPEMETLPMAATEYDTLQGTKVDGMWQDYESCEWNEAFYGS